MCIFAQHEKYKRDINHSRSHISMIYLDKNVKVFHVSGAAHRSVVIQNQLLTENMQKIKF